jgi:Type VI secretion system effector, Hcp
MRILRVCTAVAASLCALVVLPRPAASAFDTYIRLDSVGESSANKHHGWIEISSWSFGVGRTATVGSATSGGGAGKIKFNQISVKPTPTPTPTPNPRISCASMTVTVLMADGSVIPARYVPDALGGCLFAVPLTDNASKYGRVKVHFYWDRQGKSDDTSSSWLLQPGKTSEFRLGVQNSNLLMKAR